MPLGLNDLNKKRNQKSAKKGDATSQFPAGAWVGGNTARPWSQAELAKGRSRNRKRANVDDCAMNEDWINLCGGPIFRLDYSEYSSFWRIQERLCRVETMILIYLARSRRVLRQLGLRS